MKKTPLLTGTLESALYVDDLDAAERFYGGTLGLQRIAAQPGRHLFFRVGDSVLLIFRAAATSQPAASSAPFPVPAHGATGQGHYCFAVPPDQLQEWRLHLEKMKVEIEADFRWPNGARSIYVRDPGGNSVEFAEPRLWFDV